MRTSGSELGWVLRFELGLPVSMVMGAPVVYPLEDSISILLVFSLGTLYVLMIGIVEGFLVCLSLKIPLGSPLNSPNPELTVIILGIYLGNILV